MVVRVLCLCSRHNSTLRYSTVQYSTVPYLRTLPTYLTLLTNIDATMAPFVSYLLCRTRLGLPRVLAR